MVASSRNTACACVFVSEEGEECPAPTQLSKHIPVSCLAPLLSRRNNFTWIYLFISPRPGPSSHIGIVVRVPHHPTPPPPRCPITKKSAWQTTLGTFKRRTRRKHKKGWKKTPTHSSLITSFFCLKEAPAIRLPVLGPESLRVA